MRFFSSDELTNIIQGAIQMEEKLLDGKRDIFQVVSKVGEPFVGEHGELGYELRGKDAFLVYEDWVKETWRVNDLVQNWINEQLGIDTKIRKSNAPTIVPSGDTLCFRCDSCGCDVVDGYVLKNTLRHSEDCKRVLKDY